MAKKEVTVVPQSSLPQKFVAGAFAGSCAEFATTPLEVMKTRLQLSSAAKAVEPGRNIGLIVDIYKNEGIKAIFKGVSPGIARQVIYCGGKLAVYDSLRDGYSSVLGDNAGAKLLAGGTAGGLANFFSTPADLMKVRFQADATGAVAKRGLLKGWLTVLTEEGISGLWRGWRPAVARAVAVNAVELGTYDIVKSFMVPYMSAADAGDDVRLHFAAGSTSGLLASVASLPFDVIKSRMMVTGSEYTGVMDCFKRTLAREGAFSFLRGFVPTASRIVPFNLIQFMLFEQARIFMNKNKQ